MAQTPLAFDKHIQDWCGSSKASNALYKGANAYKIITTLFQILFLVAAFAVMVVTTLGFVKDMSSTPDFTKLMNDLKETLELSKLLIIVSSAIGIAAALWYILDTISTLALGGWVIKNDVNVLPELKQGVDLKFGRKAKARFRKIATAASMQKNKSIVVISIIASVIRIVAAILIAIAVIDFIGNTLLNNLIAILELSEGGSTPDIDIKALIDGYQPFVIMFGVAIGLTIIASIIDLVWKNQCFGWIRSEVVKDYNAGTASEKESAINE